MISPTGWEKRLLITLFITLFLCLFTNPPAVVAFGPKIVDVTTKAFSVTWTTTVNPYPVCGIKLYTNNNLNIERTDISESQKIDETGSGYPGEAGRDFGIAKVTVVGLDINTDYYFRVTENGSVLSGNYPTTVKTQQLKGLSSNDPADNDIVSNDIVHKAIYQSDGTSPAIGALVLADIYPYDATDFVTGPTLSKHPISAWVGDGMIGDDSSEYNPENISYKQYAALNMNNIFGTDRYPLSLQGDNPDTENVNESEIIKFTIVHGTQSVLGKGTGDSFISFGRIETVVKMNNEKITTAMVSASFKFEKGFNAFAFPGIIPSWYTTGDLLQAIEDEENKEGIVESVYMLINNNWTRTYKTIHPIFGAQIVNSKPLQSGQGSFIVMKEDMTKEVPFYLYSNPSVELNLASGSYNLISVPQLTSDDYTTGDLLLGVESAGAGENSVESVYSFDGQWRRTYKTVHPIFGAQIQNPLPMKNYEFYIVVLKATGNDVSGFNPHP